MANVQDINTPYSKLYYEGIQYSNCREYNHLSRYKGLRQVIHNYDDISNRFVSLETPNEFESSVDIQYHEVTTDEENRLDIIAQRCLGSASYSWVIAYFNKIEDGFTAYAGQTLKMPKNITSLLNQGELLGNINALKLNLGQE